MKLAYRGVEYDYNPPMLEVTESETLCQYRGHAAPYTYVRHVPIPQMAERLTYRGVAYQTTRQGGIQQLSQSAEGHVQGQSVRGQSARAMGLAGLRNRLVGLSPKAQARRELVQEASRLHKESINRSLQHRIEVAKAQGNQRLIEQLESEMRQTV
jgi:hypothetical protein